MDHATVFVHIEHMINFTAMETIQAKGRFEKKMLDMGVLGQFINLTMEFLHHQILWMRSTKNVCKTSHLVELALIIKMGLLKEASNPS